MVSHLEHVIAVVLVVAVVNAVLVHAIGAMLPDESSNISSLPNAFELTQTVPQSTWCML